VRRSASATACAVLAWLLHSAATADLLAVSGRGRLGVALALGAASRSIFEASRLFCLGWLTSVGSVAIRGIARVQRHITDLIRHFAAPIATGRYGISSDRGGRTTSAYRRWLAP
jgi:hypothetical protein